LENFTSIFELLSAFNFALVISNDFLVAVNIKIIGYLADIKTKASNVENVLKEEVMRYIAVSLKKRNHRQKKERFTTEDTKCQELLNTLNNINQDIKGIENKLSFSTNFTAYCLFSGIYCTLVLLISGLDNHFGNSLTKESKILFNEFFALQNIFYILIIYSAIKLDKKNWLRIALVRFETFSLRNVVNVYCTAGGLAIIISLIVHAILNKSCSVELYNFNIFLCLLIPSSHFIFGFFRALTKDDSEVEKLKSLITPFESEVNIFKERVQGIEGVDIKEFLKQQTIALK